MHCILCILLYALYSMPCIICIVFHALYSIQCIWYIIFYVLYYMHHILCIVFYALYYMHCILFIVFYSLYSMHCILCIIVYALFSIHWILFIVYNALSSMHCKPLNFETCYWRTDQLTDNRQLKNQLSQYYASNIPFRFKIYILIIGLHPLQNITCLGTNNNTFWTPDHTLVMLRLLKILFFWLDR